MTVAILKNARQLKESSMDTETMERAFEASISKLRKALNSIDNGTSQLQKSYSTPLSMMKSRIASRKYSPAEMQNLLRRSFELLKCGSIDTLMATKIEGRLTSGLDLSNEMKKALGYTPFPSSSNEEVIECYAERGGMAVPRSKRETVKRVALEKALKGEIDSLMLTKIEGRMNNGTPLSVEMIKALNLPMQFEESMKSILSKAAEDDDLDEYDEEEDDEHEEDEEQDEEIARSPIINKSRTQSFADYNGNSVRITNDELYRRIQKSVSEGKINPLDVVKIESRVNRGERLPESFLRRLFCE